MGDDQRRAAAQQPVERALDQQLGRAVDVRRRLVEDQDPRVGEERAGDRDQLALAGREAAAALAHRVAEALGEPPGEPVETEHRRRLGDLVVARVGAREADVVGDRAREQERVLQHDAELAAVRAQVELAQVDAVGQDRALERVVEAGDELGERRLAAARLADERACSRPRGSRGRSRAAPRCCRTRRRRRRTRRGRASVPDRRGRSGERISGSVSSTVETLIIAAVADWSWL